MQTAKVNHFEEQIENKISTFEKQITVLLKFYDDVLIPG